MCAGSLNGLYIWFSTLKFYSQRAARNWIMCEGFGNGQGLVTHNFQIFITSLMDYDGDVCFDAVPFTDSKLMLKLHDLAIKESVPTTSRLEELK